MPITPLPTLINQLQAAIRVRDRALAYQIAQAILQQLAAQAMQANGMEQQVAGLLSQLDLPQSSLPPLPVQQPVLALGALAE